MYLFTYTCFTLYSTTFFNRFWMWWMPKISVSIAALSKVRMKLSPMSTRRSWAHIHLPLSDQPKTWLQQMAVRSRDVNMLGAVLRWKMMPIAISKSCATCWFDPICMIWFQQPRKSIMKCIVKCKWKIVNSVKPSKPILIWWWWCRKHACSLYGIVGQRNMRIPNSRNKKKSCVWHSQSKSKRRKTDSVNGKLRYESALSGDTNDLCFSLYSLWVREIAWTRIWKSNTPRSSPWKLSSRISIRCKDECEDNNRSTYTHTYPPILFSRFLSLSASSISLERLNTPILCHYHVILLFLLFVESWTYYYLSNNVMQKWSWYSLIIVSDILLLSMYW